MNPTTDAARREGPASAASRWTVLGFVPAIAVVLVAGLVLRLVLAFVFFPQSGLWSDINLFSDWSLTLADHGVSGFYTQVYWSDYTPGYLWVLWAYGQAMKVVAGLTGGAASELIPIWIKLPAIVADIVVAWVFYRAIRRWHSERWGVIVAAVYLFIPVSWYDSALWGQVDTMGVLVGGLALIWLIDKRPELASGAAMAAVLIKPQFGIFLPVVGLVLLRRHFHLPRRPDYPRFYAAGQYHRLKTIWARQDREGPLRLVTSAAVAFLVLLAIAVPFDLESRAPDGWGAMPIIGDLRGLLALVSTTAGSYNFLTANAFNPWAMVGPTPLTQAIGGDYTWTYDSLEILGLPASLIGTALFVTVALGVAVLLWRRQDRDAILIAATTLAVAFFVLPTRVHERYLFAAIGIGLLLLPRSRGWWAWFAAASTVGLINMHAVLSLAFRGYGTVEMRALPFADLAREPLVVTLTALATIPVLLWPIYDGYRHWRGVRLSPLAEPFQPSAISDAPSATPPILSRISLATGTSAAVVAERRRPPLTLPAAVEPVSVRAPGTGWTLVLIGLASLLMAVLVNRLSGLGPEWLWNWDSPQGYYPNTVFFHEAITQFRLPLWSDSLGMGYPLYSGGQTGTFYPPNWLIHQLPPLQALNVTRLLHLVLAGMGAGWIVLRLTGVRAGALVAALIAVGCGGVVAKLEWVDLVSAYAWLPWILLPLLWHRRAPGWGAIALAGLLWGVQCLGGFPPIWVLTGIAVGFLLLYQFRSWRAIGPVALFGVIGVGVGAIQLAPTFLLLPLTVRSTGLDLGQLFRFSATPFDLLGFAFANAFVGADTPAWDLTRTWYTGGTFGLLEMYPYVGLPVLALAVVGLGVRRSRPLLVIALVMLAIPLIGVLQPVIWASIPGLSGLRHPVRAYVMVDMMLALAAGIAIARLGTPQRVRWAAVLVGVAVALYAGVLLIAVAVPDAFRTIIDALWDYDTTGNEEALRQLTVDTLSRPWPVILELVLGAAILVLLTRRMSRPRVRAAVAVIVCVPFAMLLPGVNQMRTESAFDWHDEPMVASLRESTPTRVLAINPPGQGYANQIALAGMGDLSVFTSLGLTANEAIQAQLRSSSPNPDLARVLGVDTFAMFSGAGCTIGQPVTSVPSVAGTVCHLDGVREGPFWIPAALVTGANTATGLQLKPTSATVDPTAALAAAVPVETTFRDDGYGLFLVDAPADGYVFIDRSWYPTWQTTVDGQAAPVSELWSGQLVPVAAGSHRIEQTMVPVDVQLGALITLLTLLLVIGGSLLLKRHAIAARRTARTAAAAARAAAPVREPAPAHRHGPGIVRGRVTGRGLLAVLLIMVGLTSVRLFNLERPLGWYFDEDLHGRTATEFLQDWRYGQPHDILEWTHPHLSKYLMAASMEALGGNEVTRTLDLGVTVLDAALEPEGANGDEQQPTPSRLFVTTDGSLLVQQLSGEELQLEIPMEGLSRLAYSAGDRQLWAVSDGSGLLRIDVPQLDGGAPESETPFISEVATLPAPIDGLWAIPTGGVAVLSADTLSLWGPDGERSSLPAPGLTDVVLVGASDVPRLALLLPDGVHVVGYPDLAPVSSVAMARRPLGADLIDGSDFLNRSRDLMPDPRLYVATRGGVAAIGGMAGDALYIESDIKMPGMTTDVRWDYSTNMVHVLGEQDGRPTIYVIEPHGTAVYADAELPATPVAWALDVRTDQPLNDRQRAVTVTADGTVAEVGLGGNVFASRLPGALAGGIGGALIVLLLLLLVRARAAAVIGTVLVFTETMLFTESRIATPDTYTIAFVVAGWTLLAWLLSTGDLVRHRWRWLLGFPTVGLLLGLAASTKWTGFYSFAGVLLFLLLVHPRLRLLAIGGTLVGALGLSLLSLRGPTPNPWMVAILVGAVALLVLWRRRWAAAPANAEQALPVRLIAWALVSIPIVGLIVYVVLFIPWTFLSLGDPQLFTGWPAGHTGETFLQLQQRMYAFHDGLTQPHGAGTPWWSWPLMLKPLWAYLESFKDLAATIIMPANPVVVWFSLPVAIWAGWRLLRGFSAPLLFLLLAFAVQWLPWVRVERVAFFYHYATAIPFALALLALFLTRVRRGLSPRAWLALRAGTVALLFFPAVLWALTSPLCSAFSIIPSASICADGWSMEADLIILLGVVALAVAIILVAMRLADRWDGLDLQDPDERGRMLAEGTVGVVIILAVVIAALAVARSGLLDTFLVTIGSPLLMALVYALIAVPLAVMTAYARSPRRLVAGVLVASIILFLLLYPGASAMLMPGSLPYTIQVLLPTWETGFQFATGPNGLLAGLLIIGLPVLLVAAAAWFIIRWLDRRTEAATR